MKIRELLDLWTLVSGEQLETSQHRVRLSLYDSAKLAALSELFPGRSEEQLLSELVSAALDELQARFPYQPSTRIQAMDEQGDPIYADEGLGPRFHDLSLVHLKRMHVADRGVAKKPSWLDWELRLRQEKSDQEAVERAENEGMIDSTTSWKSEELH